MKRILIKEIDRLYSKIHKNRFVSEYIIYLYENDVKLKTITVFGEEQTIHTMVMLLTNDFACTNIEQNIADEITEKLNLRKL